MKERLNRNDTRDHITLFFVMFLLLSLFGTSSCANKEVRFRELTDRHFVSIDISEFNDSFSHARFAYENEIPPWDLYEEDQILGFAENMVYIQNPDGCWPKNLDYQRI